LWLIVSSRFTWLAAIVATVLSRLESVGAVVPVVANDRVRRSLRGEREERERERERERDREIER
jgi:hypothetical protein